MVQTDKKLKRTVLLSSVVAALIAPAEGWAACISALIQIKVISQPLNFASVTPCVGTAGTVTLDAKGNKITTAGCISGTQGVAKAGSVKVTPNQLKAGDKVKVTITAASYTVTSGANTMSVKTFDFNLKGGGPSVVIAGNKAVTIPIGSVLHVGAGQPAGTYNGTFTVSATCN